MYVVKRDGYQETAFRQDHYSSQEAQGRHYHRTLCFSLIDCRIRRDSFSSAQQAVQRIIMQCSSLPDAISAVDYVTNRDIVGREIN
ncbi:hypothetical protein LOK49_LG05G02395 [Camellia lanceoleosa]|uniref:Uncharacterized protein n=1 Tax=Camellia lanceoleosa TaxID=1840588 RepID=A0ACC0HN45_9ERIC|nr:hypothetical protein LOK49_LG05G02395 [Camellia lanceoleosa]